MMISAPCVVSLNWTLADAHGHTIDELVDPVEFLFGGDDLLPKIEEALLGQVAGDEAGSLERWYIPIFCRIAIFGDMSKNYRQHRMKSVEIPTNLESTSAEFCSV